MPRIPKSWRVYVLRCGDGSLYSGATNDLARRLRVHASGKGARYTRSRLPVALAYDEPARDRGAALRREAALKRLTRAEKLALVAARGGPPHPGPLPGGEGMARLHPRPLPGGEGMLVRTKHGAARGARVRNRPERPLVRPAPEMIRIGISACLLGERVRWDGGHKRDAFAAGTLARLVTLVPVCPEVELGLGTPREPIQLLRMKGPVHLVGTASGADHTVAMRRLAARRARQLGELGVSGFILKSKSPSCGVEQVPVVGASGVSRTGRGLFAEALARLFPLLPLEEETGLADPGLRRTFLERAFAYRRLRDLFRPRWTLADLGRFHDAEARLLQAHDPGAHRALARIVGGARGRARDAIAARYSTRYMAAFARPAAPGRHLEALRRVLSFSLRERVGVMAGSPGALGEDYRLELVVRERLRS